MLDKKVWLTVSALIHHKDVQLGLGPIKPTLNLLINVFMDFTLSTIDKSFLYKKGPHAALWQS